MKKRIFYTEAAYIIGLLLLAFGTALTERGGFGVSMVVAPAYLLHLKISQFLPWFSFGVAEYFLQAFILLIMMLILRRARITYFLSFLTAVLYGFALDGSMFLVANLSAFSFAERIGLYLLGVILCGAGIALLFKTYFPPEAYEMFVKELSAHFNVKLPVFKTIYDCTSCVIAIILSFLFFGGFHGIGIGSVLCAFLNGIIIGGFTKLFDRIWNFTDYLSARTYFERKEELA